MSIMTRTGVARIFLNGGGEQTANQCNDVPRNFRKGLYGTKIPKTGRKSRILGWRLASILLKRNELKPKVKKNYLKLSKLRELMSKLV